MLFGVFIPAAFGRSERSTSLIVFLTVSGGKYEVFNFFPCFERKVVQSPPEDYFDFFQAREVSLLELLNSK